MVNLIIIKEYNTQLNSDLTSVSSALNLVNNSIGYVKNLKIACGHGYVASVPTGNSDYTQNYGMSFKSPPYVYLTDNYSAYQRGLAAVDITTSGFHVRCSNMTGSATRFQWRWIAIGWE